MSETVLVAPPSPVQSPSFTLATTKKLLFSSSTAKTKKRIANSPSPRPSSSNACPRLDLRPDFVPDQGSKWEEPQRQRQKEKQSKSRNGCITCKAKRFKCDETHPSCARCIKRGVPCGGYRKDFKWKPVGESFIVQKQFPPKAKRQHSLEAQTAPFHLREVQLEKKTILIPRPPAVNSASTHKTSIASSSSSFEPASTLDTCISNSLPTNRLNDKPVGTHIEHVKLPRAQRNSLSPSVHVFPPDLLSTIEAERTLDVKSDTPLDEIVSNHITDTGCSPTLSQLLLSEPGFSMDYSEDMLVGLGDLEDGLLADNLTHHHQDLEDEAQYPQRAQDEEFDESKELLQLGAEEFISQRTNHDMDSTSPNMEGFNFDFFDSDIPLGSGRADMVLWTDPCKLMFKEPQFSIGSHEMLMARFDRYTCGIMSVKDGPNENPWRSLVWPLVQENPLLYHAIASMACFHASKSIPQLRVLGMQHEKDSLAGLKPLPAQVDVLHSDVGLATAMALAFSESWDEKRVSTGINYIKVAKNLLHSTVRESRKKPRFGRDLERLKFLCKTYIYLDVISRLTSVYEDTSNDVENFSAMLSGPLEAETEVDPLMGCAGTLFPIIGRVANLVRAVYRSKSNSLSIISSAGELKASLEKWAAPGCYNAPEDPTSTVQDSFQTAEAYRWATLLHLHQAVPEIPSLPSNELASLSLRYLATVPLTSRTVIVHIYPLLVAGCEATDSETRQWVRDRWHAMAQRMAIGIIDRCSEVVTEVWRRRDAYKMRKERSRSLSNDAFIISKHGCTISGVDTLDGLPHWKDPFPLGKKGSALEDLLNIPASAKLQQGRPTSTHSLTGGLDPEESVRGKLHWISVMMGWNWQVLLG